MAQAQRLFLAHIADAGQRRDAARYCEQFFLAATFEGRIQLEAVVEVVFHCALATAGNNDDVLDAGGNGLFDAVLDDRFVDQRQHFFGYDFCGRQKTRAEAACREDRFSNFLAHLVSRSLRE